MMIYMPVLSDAAGRNDKIICDGYLWSFLQAELDPAEALLVAAHCQLCYAAKKRLKALTTCAGAVMEEIEPQTMRCSAQAFFAEKCTGEAVGQRVEMACHCNVPKVLQPLIGTSFDEINWKTVYPGIQECRLKINSATMDARLLKISKGTTVPKHSHQGIEMVLVLQGAFADEGQSYEQGEVSVHKADLNHSHAPQAIMDCICLSVTSAPIRLQGLLGRILRPFQPLLS